MQTIERHIGIQGQAPCTAKELVHFIGANLSTMNSDIRRTRKMPSIKPGNDLRYIIEPLREKGLENLAKVFDVVHSGELRLKRGRSFPSTMDARQFQVSRQILSDLSLAASNNLSLLDTHAVVREGEYRGNDTRIGELVLTFYDLVSDGSRINMNSFNAKKRVDTLSKQEGFVLSPMMREIQSRK